MRRRLLPSLLRAPAGHRGQALVEFALIVPILLVLVVSIADFGRLFSAMIATESAAREAADYGGFLGSPAWIASSYPWTGNKAEMARRACAAMVGQPGFGDSDGTCSQNPAVEVGLETWQRSTNTYTPVTDASVQCGDRTGLVDPCVVHARVTFNFSPIIPLPRLLSVLSPGDDGGGSTVTIVRDARFPISDLSG